MALNTCTVCHDIAMTCYDIFLHNIAIASICVPACM